MTKNKKKKAQPKPNLTKEVSTLANQIALALKTAKDSEELKGFGRDTVSGLRSAGNRIVAAIQKAKESGAMQDIKAQTQKVLNIGKKKTKKTVDNVSENLATGLHHISKELKGIAEQLKKK